MANKVKFNIKNVHYAPKTDEGYEKPIALPGAVSISLEAQGELSPFYADGIKYYVASSNSGYEGDLEVALVTDEFREKILKEVMDANKVMFENAYSNPIPFALGFDIDGDDKTTKFWFYNCSATRPGTSSSTTGESKEPTTDTITISCAANDKGIVRGKTTANTSEEVFNSWYSEVYTKTDEAGSAE